MSAPKHIIIVKTGDGRITIFDTSKNITGYTFVNLVKQEFTLDFDPLDETKNVVDAVLKEAR